MSVNTGLFFRIYHFCFGAAAINDTGVADLAARLSVKGRPVEYEFDLISRFGLFYDFSIFDEGLYRRLRFRGIIARKERFPYLGFDFSINGRDSFFFPNP